MNTSKNFRYYITTVARNSRLLCWNSRKRKESTQATFEQGVFQQFSLCEITIPLSSHIYCIFHWRKYIYLRENPEHISLIIFSFKNNICLAVLIDILAGYQPCKNQLLITEPEVNTEKLEVRFTMPYRPSWEETIELFCSENFKYIIILCFV